MAHYYNITFLEIKAFLEPQGFKQMEIAGTYEIVFGKRFDVGEKQLCLRIYTGIIPSGQSRGCGDDAIRCLLVMKKNDQIIKLGGSKRVHRVLGWKENLQERINKWKDYIGEECPFCKMPMVERDGRNGKFLGCSGYAFGCKYTKSISLTPKSSSPRPFRLQPQDEMDFHEGSY